MPKDFGGVIKEFQQGQLHSGSKTGPKVKSLAQAKAIAMSEQKKRTGSAPAGMHRMSKGMMRDTILGRIRKGMAEEVPGTTDVAGNQQ